MNRTMYRVVQIALFLVQVSVLAMSLLRLHESPVWWLAVVGGVLGVGGNGWLAVDAVRN